MIVPCASCGQKNRVPPERLTDEGRCGACKSAIPPLATPLDADAALFDEIVNGARVPVLIDFWASWCGPCRMAAPEVKETAAEMAGRAIVLKVDTEAQTDLARRFRVMSIPHFVVMHEGKLVHQQSGLVNHRQMSAWLSR